MTNFDPTELAFDPATEQSGVGINESILQPSSGLRVVPMTVMLHSDPTFIVSDTAPLAGSAIVNTTTWTELARYHGTLSAGQTYNLRLPTPCSISFRWTNSNATFGQKFRLRITGYDQFGAPQRETTGWITVNDPGGSPTGAVYTHGWCSKVFAVVTKVEYQASNINSSNDSIALGTRFYLDTDAALPSQNYILGEGVSGAAAAYYNQGFGVPIRLRQYILDTAGLAGFTDDSGKLDILGGIIENITQSESYPLNPYSVGAAAANELSGGFLIGQKSTYGEWEGDPHRITLIGTTSGFTGFHTIGVDAPSDVAAPPAPAWDDEYRVTVWARTTVGGGRADLPSAYVNDHADSRPVTA